MAGIKNQVLIKGTKDGLLFLLQDGADFQEVLSELEYKLQEAHEPFFEGPMTNVTIQLGNREINASQEAELRQVIEAHKNLVIRAIHSDHPDYSPSLQPNRQPLKIVSGTIRSGQVLQYDRDVLLLGDVNPGGVILSSGDILILGALRGIAHAGCEGRRDRIIAASLFVPTQLRIADRISRPPEEWTPSDEMMQFAYLEGEQIYIEQIQHVSRIRSELDLHYMAEGESANG